MDVTETGIVREVSGLLRKAPPLMAVTATSPIWAGMTASVTVGSQAVTVPDT